MLKLFLVLFSSWIFLVDACMYRGRECPNYSMEFEGPDYEIRKYPAITWASATAENRYFKIAESRAFTILASYFNQGNHQKLKINMTIPVRMRPIYKPESTVFQMDFMIPSKYADAPPIPYDEEIVIINEEPTEYAVRKFTGSAWHQATWVEEAEKLAESLKNDASVDKTSYYHVKYDRPSILTNRRNEIWMKKA